MKSFYAFSQQLETNNRFQNSQEGVDCQSIWNSASRTDRITIIKDILSHFKLIPKQNQLNQMSKTWATHHLDVEDNFVNKLSGLAWEEIPANIKEYLIKWLDMPPI